MKIFILLFKSIYYAILVADINIFFPNSVCPDVRL